MPVAANIILILIIKSTATITTTANIVVTDSDTSQSIDETRLSVSGSAIDDVSFSINCITPILSIGNTHITHITIIPDVPTAFFISLVPLTTVSSVSDKNVPTTGTRLPTANLTALPLTASSAGEEKPYIALIPVKIVIIAAISHFEIDLTTLQNPESCTLSLIFPATASTELNAISGTRPPPT